MRRKLIRQLSVGTVVVAIAAVASSSAFAASPNRGRFGPRFGAFQGGFGPLMAGGPLGGRGGFSIGIGGPKGAGGPGGAGILGADVLTPAATFLGVSVSTLESDLKGGKTLAQEATAKGKTAADLINAIVASEKTVLDAEVSAGWITSTQESNVITSLTNAITDLVNNGPAVPPSNAGREGLLQTASTYLGISVSDLQTALKSGKSLSDEVTAAGNGKTVDGLVQALLAPTKTELDGQVTAGTITQAQETAILNRLTTRLTSLVNNTHSNASATQSVLKRVITTALTIRKHNKLVHL
ncbi:MAG TPA: hypothetical protein VGL76_08960 [Gaiellaceae bacterium]|jgi:hypothetical protein